MVADTPARGGRLQPLLLQPLLLPASHGRACLARAHLRRLITDILGAWCVCPSPLQQHTQVLHSDIDLLNPPAELEKQKHKLKRLVQSPNSFFMVRHWVDGRTQQLREGWEGMQQQQGARGLAFVRGGLFSLSSLSLSSPHLPLCQPRAMLRSQDVKCQGCFNM